MNKVIRYVIRMKNGDYARQDFDDMVAGRVKMWSTDNPIDADLFKNRTTAQRVVDEVLSGNTNLLVIYNDENPPQDVQELEIEFTIK